MRKQLFLLAVLAPVLLGQPTTVVAIRNERVNPASGPVIDNGTVVLRNGLIADVGASVAIPTDSWVIEGDGLDVYPGLIDGLSSVGIQEVAATAPSPPPGAAPRPSAQTPAPTSSPARGPED